MNCKRRNMLMAWAVFAGVIWAGSSFADDVVVEGVLKSTGGFMFSDGTTLSAAGDISGNSSAGAFQVTQSGSGHAIDAYSQTGDAVHASGTNNGIYGESILANGVLGFTYASDPSKAGVVGSSQGVASGVRGSSASGDGIHGESTSLNGVYGQSSQGNGILGYTNANSNSYSGVVGSSQGVANGVWGYNASSGIGVRGSSSTGDAVHGESGGTAVYGQSSGSVGVLGYTTAAGTPNAGVKGLSQSAAYGVYGEGRSTGAGVYGENNDRGYGVVGYASSPAALAGGRFVSSSDNGTALVAESPLGTQVMKVDGAGVHAGPGMTGTPLAYGVVNADGTCTYKSANVTCSAGTTGVYYITIAGEEYDTARYVTIVTLAYNANQLVPLVDSFGSAPKRLAVVLKTPAGTLTNNRFYFVTFKP